MRATTTCACDLPYTGEACQFCALGFKRSGDSCIPSLGFSAVFPQPPRLDFPKGLICYPIPSADPPPAYYTPPPAYYTPPPAYYTSPPCVCIEPPGYYTSPPGYYASPPGYYAKPPGYYAKPPGYYTDAPGDSTQPPEKRTAVDTVMSTLTYVYTAVSKFISQSLDALRRFFSPETESDVIDPFVTDSDDPDANPLCICPGPPSPPGYYTAPPAYYTAPPAYYTAPPAYYTAPPAYYTGPPGYYAPGKIHQRTSNASAGY